MQRKYMSNHPAIKLETPLGPVWITATQREHVYVDANSDGKTLKVNYTEFPITIHLYLRGKSDRDLEGTPETEDECWRVGDGKAWDSTYHALSGSRWTGSKFDSPSDSARKKIIQKVVPVVQDYLDSHPELLVEAQFRWVNNKLLTLEGDEAKAEKALEAVRQAIRELLHTVSVTDRVRLADLPYEE